MSSAPDPAAVYSSGHFGTATKELSNNISIPKASWNPIAHAQLRPRGPIEHAQWNSVFYVVTATHRSIIHSD